MPTVNGFNILHILLVTFLTSLILVPFSKKVAKHIGAMDFPNERKIHKKVTPRLGGIAIYSSFLLGYMLYGDNSPQMLSILIGSFILIVMGMIDDINPLSSKVQFLFHLIVSSIVVFYGKIYLTEVSFFGLDLAFSPVVSYIISILFIVSLINAINLVDGLDGMSSGIGIIYFITITIVAYLLGRFTGLEVMLALIMIGSLFGFIIWILNL